ncbi:DinB family protein [Azospirillum sp. TSO22-1]|uniref:DinB family protein n=1 Tax=Azospirillum sp. TSO22-1 TaxID=716789 RepID=UPI000D6094A8|nr:DinB family protein [Azospirillum sp. TSO22-1]PWC54530.1 diguanylate cyclase [Azospirillum sp. TSO22-1]
MKPHFVTFAHYNRWANRRLYAVAAELTDAQYREDRGAFFGSLRGTLNHLLVGDRVWFNRFTGEGVNPPSLDAILHDRFDALRTAREAEDERILAFANCLDESLLDQPFSYRSMDGSPVERPLGQLLAHVFNHQTHHRGQAHTLLTQFGLAVPALDLIYFLRE